MKLLDFALSYEGPVYIRENKGVLPVLFDDSYQTEAGCSAVLKDGSDIGLITTGIATTEGVKACAVLESEGISVRHVHMAFIKPIDRAEIVKTAEKTRRIVTVENHSVYGGLGSAVAEVLCEEYPARLTRLGLQDCFGETANLKYLMRKFGIDAGSIVEHIRRHIKTVQKL